MKSFFNKFGHELAINGLINKYNIANTPYQRRLLNQLWINTVGQYQVYKYQIGFPE